MLHERLDEMSQLSPAALPSVHEQHGAAAIRAKDVGGEVGADAPRLAARRNRPLPGRTMMAAWGDERAQGGAAGQER